ncbi:MAG: phosphoglycerate kinase [Bacilli bacterium]
MDALTVRDIAVQGKRVFVRVDFNVPLENGVITDDTRIRAALPTIQYLRGQGARIVLASHLGRPHGERAPALSLRPVRDRLAQLLQAPVEFCEDAVGAQALARTRDLRDGAVLLLENVRYYKGEESNDPELAAAFAQLADVYVNDAFGAAHRAHATTEGVARLLPSAAGLLMERELSVMGAALAAPARPFAAIIGGAKVSDKIRVIKNLLTKVDALLIGGGMANTFLLAQGHRTGRSLVEADKADLARGLLALAAETGKRLLLPVDLVAAKRFAADAPSRIVALDEIQDDELALDIGPQTIRLYTDEIARSRTIIWNGPMGVFEMEQFAVGTSAVAQAVAAVQGVTIIGGGDSVAAVEKAGLTERMTHISTGGGASLEFLEGRLLPGVEALRPRRDGNL